MVEEEGHHTMGKREQMGGSTGVGHRHRKQGKTWAGAFILVSSERIGKGGFTGLALLGLNNFNGSGT